MYLFVFGSSFALSEPAADCTCLKYIHAVKHSSACPLHGMIPACVIPAVIYVMQARLPVS
jgi:hypothetical protein